MGPASNFSIPAFLQSCLIAMTSNRLSTSFGRGPKRSINSALKESISLGVSRAEARRYIDKRALRSVIYFSGISTVAPIDILGLHVSLVTGS